MEPSLAAAFAPSLQPKPASFRQRSTMRLCELYLIFKDFLCYRRQRRRRAHVLCREVERQLWQDAERERERRSTSRGEQMYRQVSGRDVLGRNGCTLSCLKFILSHKVLGLFAKWLRRTAVSRIPHPILISSSEQLLALVVRFRYDPLHVPLCGNSRHFPPRVCSEEDPVTPANRRNRLCRARKRRTCVKAPEACSPTSQG